MSKIINFLPNLYVKGLNKFSRGNFAQKWIGIEAPAAIGTITTLSCATKDALNCVYYVKQSLDNKRIPEDKRTFVAGMDFVNGVLNVGLQLATGLWFNAKFLPQIFDDHVAPKFFGENLTKKILDLGNVEKYGQAAIRNMTPELAEKVTKKLKKAGKTGLAALSTLLLTQIFIKRVVVPLIATPAASFIKKNMGKNHHKHHSFAGKDSCSFENNSTKTQTEETKKTDLKPAQTNLNKNLPQCFKSFMK